jgi:hypothetical protein
MPSLVVYRVGLLSLLTKYPYSKKIRNKNLVNVRMPNKLILQLLGEVSKRSLE